MKKSEGNTTYIKKKNYQQPLQDFLQWLLAKVSLVKTEEA
jgi:hypothetical protein